MKVSAQCASTTQANFMEHPGEIHDAASPVVGAAGSGVLSRCLHGVGETSLLIPSGPKPIDT
jgi:hypothetical protein